MGDTDIVPDADAPTVVEVASEIDHGIPAHAHLTHMEELASPVDARFTPPLTVLRTAASSRCEEG